MLTAISKLNGFAFMNAAKFMGLACKPALVKLFSSESGVMPICCNSLGDNSRKPDGRSCSVNFAGARSVAGMMVGVSVGVIVGVLVGRGVFVGGLVGVAVAVAVGMGVFVGVRVAVAVGVGVATSGFNTLHPALPSMMAQSNSNPNGMRGKIVFN